MEVLAFNRQIFEMSKNVPANLREFARIVCANIKYLCFLLFGKGVETHGEGHHLAGASRNLKETLGIGVEASWRRCIDVADICCVVMIGSEPARRVCDVSFAKGIAIKPIEDLLGVVAEADAKMIDELNFACIADARKKRHLGIGGSATYQRATGVIADAADYRGADTG